MDGQSFQQPGFGKRQPPYRRQGGVTLAEILVVMLIMLTLTLKVLPSANRLLTEQTLTSHSNALVGLLYRARLHGIDNGGAWVCGNRECNQFKQSDQVIIMAGPAGNNPSSGPRPLIEQWQLPPGMTIEWRSFQNRPWLHYRANATSHFQNGHFLLCYKGRSRKVIITRIGRPRVAPLAAANSPCTP